MRAYLALPLLLTASLPATADVKVGSPAVEINLDLLLPSQPTENAKLPALAGKAVVLEFWATWCAPCIEAIPHINEMIDQFKDKTVQFISVTDEDPDLVQSFLKKKPIQGWVGFDRKKLMQKAYGFNGIPTTVLIDANGKIAGMSHPNSISAKVIADLVAGKALSIGVRPSGPSMSITRGDTESGPPALLDVLIRPSSGSSMGSQWSDNRFEAKGMTLKTYLATAHNLPVTRVEGEPVASDLRYDVLISLPKGVDWKPVLRTLLNATFQIGCEKEIRDTPVLIVTAPNGRTDSLPETVSSGGSSRSTGKGTLKFVNQPLSELALSMQSTLNRPVVDETGLKTHIDLQLSWDRDRPEEIIEKVKGLGLAVQEGTRPLDYLVVRKQ